MKKKEIIIIGILSVGLWFISGVIQFLTQYDPLTTCSLTGYPIALCISNFEQITLYFVAGLNITIWFSLMALVWKKIKKPKKKR